MDIRKNASAESGSLSDLSANLGNISKPKADFSNKKEFQREFDAAMQKSGTDEPAEECIDKPKRQRRNAGGQKTAIGGDELFAATPSNTNPAATVRRPTNDASIDKENPVVVKSRSNLIQNAAAEAAAKETALLNSGLVSAQIFPLTEQQTLPIATQKTLTPANPAEVVNTGIAAAALDSTVATGALDATCATAMTLLPNAAQIQNQPTLLANLKKEPTIFTQSLSVQNKNLDATLERTLAQIQQLQFAANQNAGMESQAQTRGSSVGENAIPSTIPAFDFDNVSVEIESEPLPKRMNDSPLSLAPMKDFSDKNVTPPLRNFSLNSMGRFDSLTPPPQQTPVSSTQQNPLRPLSNVENFVPARTIVGPEMGQSMSRLAEPKEARDQLNRDLNSLLALSVSPTEPAEPTLPTTTTVPTLLPEPIQTAKTTLSIQPWQQRTMEAGIATKKPETRLSMSGTGIENLGGSSEAALFAAPAAPQATAPTNGQAPTKESTPNSAAFNPSGTTPIATTNESSDKGRDSNDQGGSRKRDRSLDRVENDPTSRLDSQNLQAIKTPFTANEPSPTRTEARDAAMDNTLQRAQDAAMRLQAQGGGTARIQLSDSRLGQLELQVRVGTGNSVHIEVKTKGDKVKSALEERVDDLKTSLGGHNLNLAEFKVVTESQAARNESDNRGGTQQQTEQKFSSQTNGQSGSGNRQGDNTEAGRNTATGSASGATNQRRSESRERATNIAPKTNVQRGANGSLKVSA